VNLPEIKMIGSQTPQRFVKLAQRHVGVASVRADLRHQEDRIPAIGDGPSHSALALSVVVLPGIVEEIDAGVDCFVNNPHGLGDCLDFAEMKAAETDDGHAIGMTAKRSASDRFVCGSHKLCGAAIARDMLGLMPRSWTGALVFPPVAPAAWPTSAIARSRGADFVEAMDISSVGGTIGVSHLVPYCASKFAGHAARQRATRRRRLDG
jgi:hypothetical protein